MSWQTVESDPEHFGLEHVATVEESLGWEFDRFLMLRDRTGEYLWASDSGCSCPVPFEDIGVNDMARGSAQDCLNDLKVWAESQDRGGRGQAYIRALDSAWMKEMQA